MTADQHNCKPQYFAYTFWPKCRAWTAPMVYTYRCFFPAPTTRCIPKNARQIESAGHSV